MQAADKKQTEHFSIHINLALRLSLNLWLEKKYPGAKFTSHSFMNTHMHRRIAQKALQEIINSRLLLLSRKASVFRDFLYSEERSSQQSDSLKFLARRTIDHIQLANTQKFLGFHSKIISAQRATRKRAA